jgi:hypothetical protein
VPCTLNCPHLVAWIANLQQKKNPVNSAFIPFLPPQLLSAAQPSTQNLKESYFQYLKVSERENERDDLLLRVGRCLREECREPGLQHLGILCATFPEVV